MQRAYLCRAMQRAPDGLHTTVVSPVRPDYSGEEQSTARRRRRPLEAAEATSCTCPHRAYRPHRPPCRTPAGCPTRARRHRRARRAGAGWHDAAQQPGRDGVRSAGRSLVRTRAARDLPGRAALRRTRGRDRRESRHADVAAARPGRRRHPASTSVPGPPDALRIPPHAHGRRSVPDGADVLAVGEAFRRQQSGLPQELVHRPCGHAMLPLLICRPAASRSTSAASVSRSSRSRTSDRSVCRSTACTSAPIPGASSMNGPVHVIDVIGDRWTALVQAASYYGLHRFADIQAALSVSTNTLADRLRMLVQAGVFSTDASTRTIRRGMHIGSRREGASCICRPSRCTNGLIVGCCEAALRRSSSCIAPAAIRLKVPSSATIAARSCSPSDVNHAGRRRACLAARRRSERPNDRDELNA